MARARTAATAGDVASVTFILKSGRTRTFDAATHGEEFADLAAEFEKNNANTVDESRNASHIDAIVSKTEVAPAAPVAPAGAPAQA